MNDLQFQQYIDNCFEDLETKQHFLEDKFGFSEFDTYEYDFDKQEMYFINDGHTEAKAKITPIGSFNSQTGSWIWAWANDVYPDALRAESAKFKTLEGITGSNLFSFESADIDEAMSWEISGLALNLLNGDGVYCNSAESTQYFYVVDDMDIT